VEEARSRGSGSTTCWTPPSSSLFRSQSPGWYRFFPLPSDLWLLVPLGFAVISTVTFFGMILNDLLRGKKGVAQAAQAGGFSLGRSLLGLPTDYGILCFAFVLWGWPQAFMLIYSLLALAALLYLAAALAIWFRKMSALG